MRITVMATMAAMLATGAWASGRDKVVVCIDRGDQWAGVDRAIPIVDKIFIPAGLALEWHGEGGVCPQHSERIIRISLSAHTSAKLHPGALAYALPNEGEHIVVFYDRMQGSASVATLLAYVFAHEMTHILQGLSVHSENGIMKARWDDADYAHMKLQTLAFSKTDLLLIRHGLAEYKDLRAKTRISRAGLAECPDKSNMQDSFSERPWTPK